jgi:hypothetical protein
MRKMRISGVLLCLSIILITASNLQSQDSGYPDTVRIGSANGDIDGEYSYPFSLSVSIFNDYDIKEIIIPVIIDGYSGWVHFDSVSYTGGRLADAGVLDGREAFSFGTDSIRVDSLVLKFDVGSGVPLPAGDGKICDLWFRPNFGGDVLVDSLPLSPYGGLWFITSDDEGYTPRFQSGSISIECDYMIGDVRHDGTINVQDILGIHKGYLGCYDLDMTAPWLADVNCDRLTDLRDVVNLYDYLYLDSRGTLCTCGNYSPSYYDDPGTPDTVWIEDDTLYAGVVASVDVGIINDEPLRGFAFALEWNGSAELDYNGFTPAPRMLAFTMILEDYQCQADNGVNPDTMFVSTWYPSPPSISSGTDAVFTMTFTPLSPGTVSFRLVSYYSFAPYSLARGGQSMLVTGDKAAILPVVAGGNIAVLTVPCGDANADIAINILDITYLIKYLYQGGPPPAWFNSADVNSDGNINILDITYLIAYLYMSGPEPVCPHG